MKCNIDWVGQFSVVIFLSIEKVEGFPALNFFVQRKKYYEGGGDTDLLNFFLAQKPGIVEAEAWSTSFVFVHASVEQINLVAVVN